MSGDPSPNDGVNLTPKYKRGTKLQYPILGDDAVGKVMWVDGATICISVNEINRPDGSWSPGQFVYADEAWLDKYSVILDER